MRLSTPRPAALSPAHIAPGEWRGVLWLALAAVLFTGVPYAVAVYLQPHTFTGFLIGIEDGNSYIAKMLAGASGDWLFRSGYSSQPQMGAWLYWPYIVLGKLLGVQASHLGYVIAFHLFRSASLVALSFSAYAFVAHFVNLPQLRRWALGLALLGSGLGWLPLLFGQSELLGSIPLDFYSPEAFGYLAAFSLPHLVLARALLLLGLLWVLRAQSGWRLAVVWLALALTHVLSAALGLVLLALHVGVLRVGQQAAWRTQLRSGAWALAGALAPLAYNAWAYWQDAYLQAWAVQNQILAPHPLHYVLAYGWLLPLAYVGWRALRAASPLVANLSAAWLLALPVLLYLPLGLQRRFAEAAWVVIVALALRGIEGLPLAARRRAWPLLALAIPSTLLLWLGSLGVALQPGLPAFRPAYEVALFEHLRQRPGARVLAAYAGSNALPAWAPVRVVIGHGPETIGLEQLEQEVLTFYRRDTPDVQRLAWLHAQDIDYVIWGPAERVHSRGWQPGETWYLHPEAVFGLYWLYRVLP